MMTNTYYLRDGTPTDANTWRELQGDASYAQVEKTTLPNGRWISTIWLGVQHESASDPGGLELFESVVFDVDTQQPLASVRHATESEAREGHQRLVKEWA
ncbi:MAG TPA: hypothetical protein VHC91_09580 [Trinickia sp.]|uniref:hypothetical protein n=1 Tax=Trinickia sp. TaxID=2571163 RepID=UPI002C1B28D0|nr:hypothetical protein [Trinickia sp.]HVW50634.1 hypothetical protein [Trinickia sp.]